MKHRRFLVKLKVWFLDQFQHEQISYVKHLGLKSQILTNQVHTLDRPLCVNVLVVCLVDGKCLVLLFQQFSFPDVGEEQLFLQVELVRKDIENVLHETGRLLVPAQIVVNGNLILGSGRVLGFDGAVVTQDVQTFLLFASFKQAVGGDNGVKHGALLAFGHFTLREL